VKTLKDQTLINLLAARRLAERQAEPYQTDTSKKLVSIPTQTWEKLLEATKAVLLEELDD
jgi:hypothetical protein